MTSPLAAGLALLAALTLPLPEDELVFDVDPATHAPLGELVEAEGLLLDPRDLPKDVIPYLEPAGGLEGLEASLTALMGRSLGFAAERRRLHRRYRGGLWRCDFRQYFRCYRGLRSFLRYFKHC